MLQLPLPFTRSLVSSIKTYIMLNEGGRSNATGMEDFSSGQVDAVGSQTEEGAPEFGLVVTAASTAVATKSQLCLLN